MLTANQINLYLVFLHCRMLNDRDKKERSYDCIYRAVAEPGVGQMGLSPSYGSLSPIWSDFGKIHFIIQKCFGVSSIRFSHIYLILEN